MPGAMHRMGVYLGLVEDDDYADADGYAPPAERAPARRDEYPETRHQREKHPSDVGYGAAREFSAREFDRDLEPTAYAPEAPSYQITALHPRTYNEARNIGEQFRR